MNLQTITKSLLHSRKQVKAVSRKKIVFVIVEGPSDDDALGMFLDELFDQSTVHVEIMHCDVTTERDASTSNIRQKCCDIIKKYAEKNHFAKEHFQQVIHLVDTDGAFISDDIIETNTEQQSVLYFPDKIFCKNRNDIISRNKQKSSILNMLVHTSSIWGTIPYRVFYMSCNLDHVLYDKPNSTDEEKEANSWAFAKKYVKKPEELITFFSQSDFSVHGSYQETWEYIMKENNSLNRHTNFSLCFPTQQQIL